MCTWILCILAEVFGSARWKFSKSLAGLSFFLFPLLKQSHRVASHCRYGSIKIPPSIGVEEMRRECAFFQLPDDVVISCQDLMSAISEVIACKEACKKRALERVQDAQRKVLKAEGELLASTLYKNVLENLDALQNGEEASASWWGDELLGRDVTRPVLRPTIAHDVARFAREDGFHCSVRVSDSNGLALFSCRSSPPKSHSTPKSHSS